MQESTQIELKDIQFPSLGTNKLIDYSESTQIELKVIVDNYMGPCNFRSESTQIELKVASLAASANTIVVTVRIYTNRIERELG